MQFQLNSIGIIHTDFQEASGIPIQSARSEASGWVEVDPDFLEGLKGIEEFSRIYLFYILHKSPTPDNLLVQPFLDDRTHGVFATRYPIRPNSLGFSNVQLISREGNILHFSGADMLDGTPLLDIKPFVPDFDVFSAEKIGWYQYRKYK